MGMNIGKSMNDHYSFDIENEKKIFISDKKLDRIHRLVNLSKEMRVSGFSSNGRTFHTCFCLKKNGGKVVEFGWNNYDKLIEKFNKSLGNYTYYNPKDHPESSYKPSLHAEASTIMRLGNMDNSQYDFINIRINRNGKCCSSRPCEYCFKMLKNFGYNRLYWFENGEWYCIG